MRKHDQGHFFWVQWDESVRRPPRARPTYATWGGLVPIGGKTAGANREEPESANADVKARKKGHLSRILAMSMPLSGSRVKVHVLLVPPEASKRTPHPDPLPFGRGEGDVASGAAAR